MVQVEISFRRLDHVGYPLNWGMENQSVRSLVLRARTTGCTRCNLMDDEYTQDKYRLPSERRPLVVSWTQDYDGNSDFELDLVRRQAVIKSKSLPGSECERPNWRSSAYLSLNFHVWFAVLPNWGSSSILVIKILSIIVLFYLFLMFVALFVLPYFYYPVLKFSTV